MNANDFEQWLDSGIALLCNQGIWHFGTNKLTEITSPYAKKFDCVYFLTHPKYPAEVKIGMTCHLRGRIRAYKSHFSSEPSVIAVFETPKSAFLERLLLEKFAAHRLHGEWFSNEPIYLWLEAQS